MNQIRGIKLVLTGGPSGGKTTVAQAISREFSDQVVMVPEAASILWGGGWPRRKSVHGVKHQQRAIYWVQREVESLLSEENLKKLLICDRGSLDGMAYWPEATQSIDYLKEVNSTQKAELSRYDWVIHLDTAPEAAYDTSNPLRTESFEEAMRLNDRVREAWSNHPQRFIIRAHQHGQFLEKLHKALTIVQGILDGRAYQEILSLVDGGIEDDDRLV